MEFQPISKPAALPLVGPVSELAVSRPDNHRAGTTPHLAPSTAVAPADRGEDTGQPSFGLALPNPALPNPALPNPELPDPALSDARRAAQTEAVQTRWQMLTVAMRIDDAHAQAASTLAAMGPNAPLHSLQPPVIKIPSIQELYTRAIQDIGKIRR